MLDTITLQIARFEIPAQFLANFQQTKSGKNTKYVFNPDATLGNYLPRITIKKIEGQYGTAIENDIEFSIPKLLHNTNYYGVDEADRQLVVDTLFDKLTEIFKGSPITKQLIEGADIKNLAFSFNFILPPNYGRPIEFLKVIPFLDIGKNYHKRKDTYYNESSELGFCGRIYNTQVSWKMYDKGAEIIANAKNRTEKDIAIKVRHGQLPNKILRMELTYQNRFSLKRHLKTRIGGNYNQERHLKEVFNNKLCQEILLESFDKIANALNVKAMDTPLFPIHEYFKATKQAKMSLVDAYTWMGRTLAIQQAGSYQLKLISDESYTKQQRAMADKKIEKLLQQHALPSFTIQQVFDECRKQLVAFQIMKPDTS